MRSEPKIHSIPQYATTSLKIYKPCLSKIKSTTFILASEITYIYNKSYI